MGHQGIKGEKGISGLPGPTGPKGATGQKSVKGYKAAINCVYVCKMGTWPVSINFTIGV